MSEYPLIIDGRKVTTTKQLDVFNPANGELVGSCAEAGREHLDAAVAAARNAFASWSSADDAERKQALHRMADALEANAAELATLLTREQGKPLNGMGSQFEIGGAVAWTRYNAEMDLPVEVLEETDATRIEMHRKPLGVVGSITPWNWPVMIAIWHIMPAIRTGCTVVLKPSSFTPLSTLRMVELFNEVLPPGVLNVVAGGGGIGRGIASHEGIDKIVFTGSTPTGRSIMENAAPTLKRLTLELGGNDAGIMLHDADPEALAEKLFWGSFINGGQTCAALKRLYVHDSIYDKVCDALTNFAANIPVGDGLDENSLIGPIQNRAQFDYVCELVDDAVANGAKVLCGGKPTGKGLFYPLTLIADADDGMRVVDEEQFGPVLPIIRYSDVDDAVRRANNSENGLGGSVWSSDLEAAQKVASRLECGTAWVNKHAMIQPDVPFGGVKASGFGVEFGRPGLEEYTSIQVINIDK